MSKAFRAVMRKNDRVRVSVRGIPLESRFPSLAHRRIKSYDVVFSLYQTKAGFEKHQNIVSIPDWTAFEMRTRASNLLDSFTNLPQRGFNNQDLFLALAAKLYLEENGFFEWRKSERQTASGGFRGSLQKFLDFFFRNKKS